LLSNHKAKLVMVVAAVMALSCLFAPAAGAIDWSFGGGLGLTRMDDEFFLSTTLYPDFAVGKLGVGMEFTLNFNKEGLRKDDWQPFSKALARSIRYIRWGHKGDPLYLQFGTLFSNNLGTGILVKNYTNRSTADVRTGARKLGLVADVDLGLGGVETMVNNTLNPTLFAARAFVYPAKFVPVLPFLERLSVGISLAKDVRNDYQSGGVFTGLQGIALDAIYPLSRNIMIYIHRASLRDVRDGALGSGLGAGIQGTFGPVYFIAEGRSLSDGFAPGVFSKSYEEMGTPATGTATQGYLAGIYLNMYGEDLVFGLQQEFNALRDDPPAITGSLTMKGPFLKGITGGRNAEFAGSYSKAVVKGGANAYLNAELKVEMIRGAYVVYQYDAVINPQGQVNSKQTAGMYFGRF